MRIKSKIILYNLYTHYSLYIIILPKTIFQAIWMHNFSSNKNNKNINFVYSLLQINNVCGYHCYELLVAIYYLKIY